MLRRRRIALLFLTGYSQAALPRLWRNVPLIEKPLQADVLVRELRSTIAGVMAEPFAERVTTAAIRRSWDRVRNARDLLTEQRAWAENHNLERDPT